MPEYTYNLKLARQIQGILVKAGFSGATLITVQGIGKSQLLMRSARANALDVNLLLSIHHDDVQDSYHAKWTYKGVSRVFSDRFSGHSLFISRQNPQFEASLAFAKLLGAGLIARGMRYSSHHSEPIPGEARQLIDDQAGVYLYDQLVVLKSAKSPAVLLEAGVIVNRAEELVLGSVERRREIAAAVLDAVNQFCAERQHPETKARQSNGGSDAPRPGGLRRARPTLSTP